MRPEEMSQAELNDYLDELVERGMEDTAEFDRAYTVWDKLYE